ncbi:MAG: hypothetical protein Kow0059_16510 [Candidatus Sumerlaeia bacterium]
MIVVLLVLTVLAILAITLSYTTRLEAVSAANYSAGIQARTAAVTGVAVMSSRLEPYSSVQAPLMASNRSFWSSPRAAQVSADAVNRRTGERARHLFQLSIPPISDLYAEDTSAKLNLNTATPGQMQRLFSAVLAGRGVDGGRAAALARALAEWRLGPDGRPGRAGVDDDQDAPSVSTLVTATGWEARFGFTSTQLYPLRPAGRRAASSQADAAAGDGLDNDADGEIDEPGEQIDEPDEYIADIRRPAYGDDRRLFALSDLNYVPGWTPEIIQALTPYLTVYSESWDSFVDGSGEDKPRVNLNDVSLSELIGVLNAQFPDKDPMLLAQFALNVLDYRDADSIPTSYPYPGGGGETLLFGVEIQPFISEVWPDSASSDDAEDDDGQFVELINPWPVDLSVDGWRLATASGDVVLRGEIAARGFLIVTDDLDDAADQTPEDDKEREFGSFYRIFGLVPDGRQHRMVEHSAFDLPNDEDTVELRDAQGHLMDAFHYRTQGTEQYKYSWQREDPRLRASRLEPCSPYMPGKGLAAHMDQFQDVDPRRDRLFHSVAHVLGVSSGYVRLDAGGREIAAAWQLPALSAAGGSGNVDLGLVDIFTVDTHSERPAAGLGVLLSESALGGDGGGAVGSRTKPVSLIGRLNVNTLSPEMLKWLFDIDVERLMVPVEDSGADASAAQLRHRFAYTMTSRSDAARSSPSGPLRRAVYQRRSDFLEAAVRAAAGEGADRESVIKTLAVLLPQISLNSVSYSVLSQNRLSSDSSREREQARALVRATVSLDGEGGMQLINWQYLH